MPLIPQVRQDTLMTRIALTWGPTGHVANQVVPPIPVRLEDGQYTEFGKERFNTPEAQRRPRSRYKQIDWTMSKQSYHAEEYGLEGRIDDRERENSAGVADLDETTTEILTDNILNIRERRIANMVLSTANVPQNTTLAGATQWSDTLGGDPVGVSITAQNTIQGATGYLPNTLTMGFKVWQALRNNAKIKTFLDTGELLSKQKLATILGVEEIIVGSVLYNTSKSGANPVLGDVWGKDALFSFRNPRPADRRPSFAYQFVVKDLASFRWRDVPVNCDVLRVREIRAEKIVASSLGYLVKAAVA